MVAVCKNNCLHLEQIIFELLLLLLQLRLSVTKNTMETEGTQKWSWTLVVDSRIKHKHIGGVFDTQAHHHNYMKAVISITHIRGSQVGKIRI